VDGAIWHQSAGGDQPKMGEDVKTDLILKLKEIFRSDRSDLDFGIYRILNFRRKEIERFIEKDLVKQAESEFSELVKANFEEQKSELDGLKEEINMDFGEGTIDANGEVRRLHDAPKIKRYIELKQSIADQERVRTQINEVFNHVYEFFSRYYDKGDFISQRRFGGREKYIIPHNGEEVYLYWANQDQYYIKTSEYFEKYNFVVGTYHVNFILKNAELESNNVKSNNKYFLLSEDNSLTLDEARKELNIYFNYREISSDEKNNFGTKNVQDTITAYSVGKIFSEIGDRGPEKELNRTLNNETTVLEKHISKYIERNKTDYFIHKNLKSFLERELEFYLKNEVLHFDEIDQMDDQHIRIHKVKIRTTRKLCKKIIDFLVQIEDFQKKLFEKKKLVLSTDYCMTLDYVPESFYQEIGNNELQVNEWKTLFNLDEKTQNTLQNTKGKKKLPVEFLKTNKNLVLDTCHFSDSFKWRLLSSLDDLDNLIDGLLFRSENFQALNLLLEKYRNSIKCVYIDPPYNTGSDEFLYKDKFKHSSWLSMIFDRVLLSHALLTQSGTIGVSIDNNELDNFLKLMDIVYKNRRAIITIKRGSVTGPKVINPGVVNVAEFLVLYSKSETDWVPNRVYRKRKRDDRYNKFILNRDRDPSEWKFTLLSEQFAKFKGIPKNRIKRTLGSNYEKELDDFVLNHADSVVRTAALDNDKISQDARELKVTSKGNPNIIYQLHREKYDDWYIMNGERILFYSDGLVKIGSKTVRGELVTDIWTDTLPNDLHNEGGVTLKKGKKPEKMIGRFFELTTNNGELILDFFVGSGTACAAAQKMGRKWIGVDMAHFFNSLLIKRLKNTLFGEGSGISSINEWKGGGFFKYHALEQFEDTLNNILFSERGGAQTTLQKLPDYFLQHVLNVETKDSPTRLTVDRFKTPFDYKIKTLQGRAEKTEPVDLVETFNYLLGIRVKKIRQYENEQTKYIIIYGEKGEEPSCTKVLIIWRNYNENMLEKEKHFIEQKIMPQFNPDIIYINVDSFIKGAESIEPKFKELMGA